MMDFIEPPQLPKDNKNYFRGRKMCWSLWFKFILDDVYSFPIDSMIKAFVIFFPLVKRIFFFFLVWRMKWNECKKTVVTKFYDAFQRDFSQHKIIQPIVFNKLPWKYQHTIITIRLNDLNLINSYIYQKLYWYEKENKKMKKQFS